MPPQLSEEVRACCTVLLSGLVNVRALARVWRSGPFSRGVDRTQGPPAERIPLYAFYMLLALLITVGLSPVQPVHWHLVLGVPVVATLMTLAFNALRDRWTRGRIDLAFGVILLVFATFNTLGFLGSRAHSYRSDLHRDFMAYYAAHKGAGPAPASTR